MRRELLIGCGRRREKFITFDAIPATWQNLTTLDVMAHHEPDVVHDLDVLPYPFEDETFDEIHAYEVLEHCGRQGDWRFFFAQWNEFYRIMKPGAFFVASCPAWDQEWAWGDPGHTRIITPKTLMFLDQEFYRAEVGTGPASDYRAVYTGDFEQIGMQERDAQFFFVLKRK